MTSDQIAAIRENATRLVSLTESQVREEVAFLALQTIAEVNEAAEELQRLDREFIKQLTGYEHAS